MGADGVQVLNGGGGENFPATAAVRTGAVGFDGEDVVQEKDTLLLPGDEGAGWVRVAAEVGIDLFVNVLERRRDFG